MIKAIVLHFAVSSDKDRNPNQKLEEVKALSKALSGIEVVDARIITLKEITPATYMGKGNVQLLAETVKAFEIDMVMINTQLSPIQQRNLEKELKAKVIDRTALILEIFAQRAQTKEGRLQVRLAQLMYQKSRLVRTWTHLERQRGGSGFLAGPGERQLELDKRMLGEEIKSIKKDLDAVKKTRSLHRKKRKDIPYPIVVLVGYTNAGKSTLFNNLTASKVFAKDLLFATLDPTLRKMRLPSGREVILSDTVGFISDLPTELVAAFRATLEEVSVADLILHVRDISHDETDQQKADVLKILKDLHVDPTKIIEVKNKIDLSTRKIKDGVSARTGEGIDRLKKEIEDKLFEGDEEVEITIPYDKGRDLDWLYRNGRIESRKDLKGGVKLKVKLSAAKKAEFEKNFKK